MKQKTILFINLRKSIHEAREAIVAAKGLNYRILLLTDSRPVNMENYVTDIILTNTYDINESLDKIKSIQKKYNIHGVITFGDKDVELMAHIAAYLHLPGPSVHSAKNARNKYCMRSALSKLNELLPNYYKVNDEDSLNTAIRTVGFPAIIKPTGASGSKGIFKVNNANESKQAFAMLLKISDPMQDKIFSYYGSEYIFEEYLDGNEYSVEGWVYCGEVFIAGITDKETTDPYHIEYQHIFPSNLPESTRQIIQYHSTAIIKELGIDFCAFHLEAKLTSRGFKLVEVAARTGGDYITSHLVPIASGINFYQQILKVITDQKPSKIVNYYQYAGTRVLLANRSGLLQNISNLKFAASHPYVLHIFQEQSVGRHIILPPNNFSDLRILFVIGCCGQYKKLEKFFIKFSSQCEVITKG